MCMEIVQLQRERIGTQEMRKQKRCEGNLMWRGWGKKIHLHQFSVSVFFKKSFSKIFPKRFNTYIIYDT
jgi:hypothetical protein